MMNTRIPYTHILFSLALLLVALMIGFVLMSIEPGTTQTALASSGTVAADSSNS